MERDDKRARRPPARKTEPEGMEKNGEPIIGAAGKDIDLRAGQQRQELGRNPRGGPVSVNEMLARYKEAQARKFAEHGSDNRQEAPADIRTDTSQQQDLTETTGQQPLARSADDIPIIRQTPKRQAVPQQGERPVFSFIENGAGTENTRNTARLRFDNIQRAVDASAAPIETRAGTEQIPDSSIVSEEPTRDFQPMPAPPVRNTLSHKHALRSYQERKGFLQHSRIHSPDEPLNPPHKRNTQQASERFISSGEVKHEPAAEGILKKPPLVQDFTAPAAVKDSVISEQPPPRDSQPMSAPPACNSLSHEHAPRSYQERQGLFQQNRVHSPDEPQNIPHKRNTQRDSERFISSGEVRPEPAAAPVRDNTVSAAVSAEGFHQRGSMKTTGQPVINGCGDTFTAKQTPEPQAVSPREERLAVSSDARSETPLTDNITATPAETVTESGRSPDSPVTPVQTQNPLPDGSRPERNTLSHTRLPRSKQNREARLRHIRSRLPDIPKDARQKNNTQRGTNKFMPPEWVKPETGAISGVAEPFEKLPFIKNIFAFTEEDERVQTVGKLKFTDEEAETPVVADTAANTHIDADTVIEKEQPQDSPLSGDSEEEPPTADDLPETKTPPRDSTLSHTRESVMTHERQRRLLHDIAPIVPNEPLRHKHAPHGDSPGLPEPEIINQTMRDSSADTVRTATDTPPDWRRVEDSTGSPAETPPQNDSDVPTEASPAPDTKRTPAFNIFTDNDIVIPSDTVSTAVESADGGHTTPASDSPTPANPDSTAAPASDTIAPADSDSTPTPGRGSESGGGDSHKKKDSKLKFEDAADTPEGKKSGRKLDKALGKAERSSEKLTKAQGNLPKKRKLRMNREFDAEKGKLKPRLRFEKEAKTQSEHLKGSPVTRPIKLGASAAVGYAHRKIYQVENENVAVKAAHRGEMLAERGVRSAYRFVKTAPYRKVQKLERRTAKLNIKAAYRQALHENPELAKKPLARMMQKRRIKKQYAKAARNAKRAGSKTAAVMKKAGEAAKKAAAVVKKAVSNPKVLIIIGLLFLIVILLFGVISSCSSMASGIGSSVTAMSYTAADADVDAAELYYTELETDLQLLIANTETDRAGYDEYRYYIDGIGHDPFTLMAFLSAVYHDFTFADIQSVLDGIFDEQYLLEFTPSVEIRTRTETRTGYYTGADGVVYSYTYEIEVEYNWYILTVTLTSQPLSSVISPRMDSDQSEHYALLMQSKGLRQYAASPFSFNWLPNVSSYYGYRVHPITGVKDYHLGIDIALPSGTEILAAQSGTVTFAGDLGGYGNVIVIEDSEGLVTKYAHCSTLLVNAGQTVTAGDAIATVGSTGDSTGPHLHFEVLKDNQYLNPIYFSLTSSY